MAVKRTLSLAELTQRQTAAVKHGLRARAKVNLRSRNYRAGRLLTSLFAAAVWLQETDRPAARRWAQLEVRATDLYAVLQSEPSNEKLGDMWLAVTRAQLPWAKELGLTPAALAELRASSAGAARDGVAAKAAAVRLRQRVLDQEATG